MTSPAPPGRRVAVIGDVAGHRDNLVTELRRLGADPVTGRLPADLTVIQVGDLVHRGPASDAVVALVDRYLTEQPGQWVQLVGNHEAQYLREPLFEWPEQLQPDSVLALRRWWSTGQMRAAVAVVTATESYLVTHAGLTAGFWRDALGCPADVAGAERALNDLIGRREGDLLRPGHLLTGGRRSQRAGPIWAVAATELVPSWLQTRMPFSQIHGHTSVYDWQQQRYRSTPEIAQMLVLDQEAKHEAVQLRGGRILGIDPGHDDQPVGSWRAWEADVLVPPWAAEPTGG